MNGYNNYGGRVEIIHKGELTVKFENIDLSEDLYDVIGLFSGFFNVTYVIPGKEIYENRTSKVETEKHPELVYVDSKVNGFLLSGKLIKYDGNVYYLVRLSIREIDYEYRIQLSGGIPAKVDLEARKSFKRELRRGIYTLLSRETGKKLPWGMLTGIRPAKIVHELMGQGLGRQEILNRMTGYFLLSPEKSKLLYDVAFVENDILASGTNDSVSIYIGIPFCSTRCLYCSFTSYSIKKYTGMAEKYLSALRKELHSVSEMVRKRGFTVQSIYIGGGTPTSISAGQLQDLLTYVQAAFNLGNLKEFTLEAGRPDSIDREKLSVIKNSAVSRISINPQTMNDDTLKLIGRSHSSEDFIKAFILARDMGFTNINTDLIVGLPGENAHIFEESLKQIAALGPESLTVHTLAVKRASRLNMENKVYESISEEEAALMVDTAQAYAKRLGMHPYYLYRQKNMLGNLENIGYCRPGFESIYNVQIMEEKQTILAVGAGAISKVVYRDEDRLERAFNVKTVEEYIARVDEMGKRKEALL
jgi:coproporphyrinogen dehydrogenase HemZ